MAGPLEEAIETLLNDGCKVQKKDKINILGGIYHVKIPLFRS